MHVHIVGNGSSGSGCWLSIKGWHWPLSAFMVREFGLPMSVLKDDLDRIYVDRLLEMVRNSSLGAVVILAQDLVHDNSGRPLRDVGLFHVPNHYVLDLARKHPEFLPAVSIHPARPDAIEELEKCLAGGAVMMKCLPNCQNINCNDRRFARFWERMAEAGLPLLAHTAANTPFLCFDPTMPTLTSSSCRSNAVSPSLRLTPPPRAALLIPITFTSSRR
jgi:hypothetical protein